MRLALAAMCLLTGCLPPLDGYTLIETGEDAGVLPGTDAGMPMPNPIDLGAPCPNPHLLVGTVSGSSEGARVMRIDPATGAFCRESPILEFQAAYGDRVSDVEWHAEVGELLGLYEGVLALDAEGFPAWRYQPFDDAYFRGDWVAVFGGTDRPLRIGVAWSQSSSSSIDSLVLLDTAGHATSATITPPFFAFAIAAAPDSSGRLLMPSRSGDDLEMYVVDDLSTTISEASAVPLYTVAPTFRDTYGSRNHVATDLATGRVVVARDDGIEHWRLGASPPTTAVQCTQHCTSYETAAIDPNDEQGAFAVCIGPTDRHLVHVLPGSCSILIDGTSLGSLTLTDVTLVRSPL